jgi:hypothetical protein
MVRKLTTIFEEDLYIINSLFEQDIFVLFFQEDRNPAPPNEGKG